MTRKRIRTPGHFESVRQPTHRPEKSVTKVVTVPNGASEKWRCSVCGEALKPSTQCVKVGGQIYCNMCIRRKYSV